MTNRLIPILVVLLTAPVCNAQHFPSHQLLLSVNTIDKPLPLADYDSIVSMNYAYGDAHHRNIGLGITYQNHRSLKFALRVRTVFSMRHTTVDYWTIHSGVTTNQEIIRQNSIKISPGMFWNFLRRDKITCFGGFELPVCYIGNLSGNYTYSYTNFWGGHLTTITKTHVPGGFTGGAGIFAGSSIRLGKRISISAEIFSSAGFTHYSKKISRAIETIQNNYPPTLTQNPKYENMTTYILNPFQASLSIGIRL